MRAPMRSGPFSHRSRSERQAQADEYDHQRGREPQDIAPARGRETDTRRADRSDKAARQPVARQAAELVEDRAQ